MSDIGKDLKRALKKPAFTVFRITRFWNFCFILYFPGKIQNRLLKTFEKVQKLHRRYSCRYAGTGKNRRHRCTCRAILKSKLRNHPAFISMNGAKQADFQFANLDQLVDYFRAAIGGKPNEILRALYLNSRNGLIFAENLSRRNRLKAVAFPRKIVRLALKYGATTVIIGHNHQGGLPEPSENDNAITEQVAKALKTVGISLQRHLDHRFRRLLQLSKQNGYFSWSTTTIVAYNA